jgi:hypothetical protein
MFKKREPKYWLVEQPGTMVLLLPEEFAKNDLMNQVFTVKERTKLIAIFESRNAMHVNHPGHDGRPGPLFHSDFINMGERFFAEANDLNSARGYVREFEFFAS